MPYILWICPECDSYYGASSAGDLSTEMNEPRNAGSNTVSYPRDICQYCKARGKEVHRRAFIVVQIRQISREKESTRRGTTR